MNPGRLLLRLGALFFALLTVWCVYLSATNFWTYFRMRTLPVKVVKSSLSIDAVKEENRSADVPFYVLKLDLRSTDGGGRTIHLEEELERAVYPEEAYDELERWRPGSTHVVKLLRGRAREVRLPYGHDNPELEFGVGMLIAAMFCGFFVVSFLAVMAEEESVLARIPAGFRLGAWIVFAGVGAACLMGWAAFTVNGVYKRTHWVDATAVNQFEKAEDAEVVAPERVEMTGAARQRLTKMRYRIISYPLADRTLHAGLGDEQSVYKELGSTCPQDQPCVFKINPENRWEMTPLAKWDEQFYIPCGTLFVFGSMFLGAGLLVRRSETRF